MDERTAPGTVEAVDGPDAGACARVAGCLDGDGVEFGSRQAEHGKMRLWLTAFTAVAALAVIAVVSISALHAG